MPQMTEIDGRPETIHLCRISCRPNNNSLLIEEEGIIRYSCSPIIILQLDPSILDSLQGRIYE